MGGLSIHHNGRTINVALQAITRDAWKLPDKVVELTETESWHSGRFCGGSDLKLNFSTLKEERVYPEWKQWLYVLASRALFTCHDRLASTCVTVRACHVVV